MGMTQTSNKCMVLSGGFPVQVGPHASMVYGGPYRQYIPGQRRLVGVKMAREIKADHDISIPTEDFSIPDVHDMHRGLIEAVDYIVTGHDLYVGCMGGIGRTGLFMGCLIKSLSDAGQFISLDVGSDDPVTLTRSLYSSHAIETSEQMAFVRGFDTEPVVTHIKSLLDKYVRVIPKTTFVEVPVVVEVPMSPWKTIKTLFGFKG